MTRLTLFAFSMALLLPVAAFAAQNGLSGSDDALEAPSGDLPATNEDRPAEAAGPTLMSTSVAYREYAPLNDVCRKEFGETARVADFNDLKRMINTRSDYETFIRVNGLDGRSRERLMYYNGQFKGPRDRHYYLIYNPDGVTPRGVNAIGRLRGNNLNLAAIMHIRARVLCLVP